MFGMFIMKSLKSITSFIILNLDFVISVVLCCIRFEEIVEVAVMFVFLNKN